jgi:hypothetical protein
VAHRAKWITGAGAVVLTALAAREHDRSNDQWHTLLRLCRANHAECVLDAAGRYENAAAEDLYQAALQYDRRARTRLLGGQAALLLTAALVLIDLRHGNDGPPNIPFDPLEVTPDLRARGVRVGLRLTF